MSSVVLLGDGSISWVLEAGKNLVGGRNDDTEGVENLLPLGEEILAVVGGDDRCLGSSRGRDYRSILGDDDACSISNEWLRSDYQLIWQVVAKEEEGRVGIPSPLEEVMLGLVDHIVGKHDCDSAFERSNQQVTG
jgi:hypothetical protein